MTARPTFERQATEPRFSHEDVPQRREQKHLQRASIVIPRRQEKVFALEDFPTPDDRGVERQAAAKVHSSSYLQGGYLRNVPAPQRGECSNSTVDADTDSFSPRQGASSPLSPHGQRNRGSVANVGSPRTGRRGNTGSRGGWETARDAAASDGLGGGGGSRGRGASVEDGSRGAASLSREL